MRIYEGLPWFVAAWTSALVLPNMWRHKTIHIYFRQIDTQTVRGLSILVHECFHVLQYQDLQKGYEMGMFRKFLCYYIAYYVEGFLRHIRQYSFAETTRKAYRFHPMEIPAYDQDALMAKAGNAFMNQHKSLDLLKDTNILMLFLTNNSALIKKESAVLLASPTFFTKLLGFFACIILFCINPIFEILLKIIFYFYFIFSKKKHSFVL